MPKFAYLPVFALLTIAPLYAAGQSGSFTVAQHGHTVGTASFKFSADNHGYASSSVVRIDLEGLKYALSKTEQLTAANHLEHAQLNATVNGSAVSLTAAPGANSDPSEILLSIAANGRTTTSSLPAHPAAVLLPDFDPGALETLLALGVTQNSRDLWAILPKKAGSIAPVKLATYADERGTLDGKSIVVHHLVATINGADTELFAGPENQLLQAELPQQGFALVRKGFALTPPAKAGAPPPAN